MSYYFWLGRDWSPLCSPDDGPIEADGFTTIYHYPKL